MGKSEKEYLAGSQAQPVPWSVAAGLHAGFNWIFICDNYAKSRLRKEQRTVYIFNKLILVSKELSICENLLNQCNAVSIILPPLNSNRNDILCVKKY